MVAWGGPASLDRGSERLRRAGLSGATSLVAQGFTIAAGIISVPLTVGYLGKERYGIWLTINSILQWAYVGSMGFAGNALVNRLSEADGREDRRQAQELVATAFWSLTGLALCMSMAFVALSGWIDWSSVFNTSSPPGELRIAMTLAVICYALTFPVSMIDAVYLGHQEAYVGNAWNVAGSLASLAALFLVTQISGGLPLLVGALFGVRLIVSVGNACYAFLVRYPWLRPAPRLATRRAFSSLMALGSRYFVAQVSGIGMFQSQPIIITQVLGSSAVAVFGTVQRLLTLPLLVVQALTFPLLPAYGEARARGDWPWIRRTLRRSVAVSALGSLCLLLPVTALAPLIVKWWAGADLVPGTAVTVVLATYVLPVCVLTPVSVMLYGLGRVGPLAKLTAANAVLNLALGIILTLHWGLTGMAISMAAAFLLVNPVGLLSEVRRAFRGVAAEAPGADSSVGEPPAPQREGGVPFV